MKISESWLREWIDPPASAQQIADRLVMAGLELEIEPAVAEPAHGVVVARIVEVAPHPDAERLRVCQVDAGEGHLRQIVCGAPNARVGLRVPCALPGAVLPGGVQIGMGRLRGVESAGMLCSAKELALSERSEGLLELDADAPQGVLIGDYLNLDDRILNLELTPNRGDCLSVLGLARELSALYQQPLAREPAAGEGEGEGEAETEIEIGALEVQNSADTLAFHARRVGGVDPAARTPDWMRERLRRSGIRCIHPLVDIANYVMLELGQPLHAYDAGKLRLPLTARRALAGERLQLLNDQWLTLSGELVIADADGPVGLAGAMGGLSSAVGADTRDVLFEAAAFAMDAVAGVGRRHRLSSDALYRFERGVDPAGQRRALARAVELTLEICGGQAGPLLGAVVPPRKVGPIRLRAARLDALLGITIPPEQLVALLARLQIQLSPAGHGEWLALPPSWRHDLQLEVDLIEEVARLHGYDQIPARAYPALLVPQPSPEAQGTPARLRQRLIARGWQETVSLAFAAPDVQRRVDPASRAVPLDNPLAETLAELRSSLWPGLLAVWRYNRARQVERVRLFESGVCFRVENGQVHESAHIAGLIGGDLWPEQWGVSRRPADFYDLKAEVEALLAACAQPPRFVAAAHPALHPGRSARLWLGEQPAGWLGQLHPQLAGQLEVPDGTLLFDLELAALAEGRLPRAEPISDLPSSRRDVAVIVAEQVAAEAVLGALRSAGEPLLRHAWVFDVYRGEGVSESCKSMTLGLIFQDDSRTLTVEEVDSVTHRLIAVLGERIGATARS